MPESTLAITRRQVLGFRQRVNGLEAKLPSGEASAHQAAWAGLKDSMPRAALLSLNARVDRIDAGSWEDPCLVQIWGPGYSVYVVAADDLAVFTLGRSPDDPKARHVATDLASRLEVLLDGGTMPFGAAGRALGEAPNRLRYATTTGTVVLRWDGARQPTIRSVPQPEVDPSDARRELVRRYLHIFGPSTAESFGRWAGIRTRSAVASFDELRRSLTAVTTPVGAAWMLSSDEDAIRRTGEPKAVVRLLPSGDTYFLLSGTDRELVVPDAAHRDMLWTPRVWPGAILADGEIVGTWRHAKTTVRLHVWNRVGREVRERIEAEAAVLPVPENDGRMTVVCGSVTRPVFV